MQLLVEVQLLPRWHHPAPAPPSRNIAPQFWVAVRRVLSPGTGAPCRRRVLRGRVVGTPRSSQSVRWHPVGTDLAARAGLAQARSGQETLRHEPRGLHAPHPCVNSTQQTPPLHHSRNCNPSNLHQNAGGTLDRAGGAVLQDGRGPACTSGWRRCAMGGCPRCCQRPHDVAFNTSSSGRAGRRPAVFWPDLWRPRSARRAWFWSVAGVRAEWW